MAEEMQMKLSKDCFTVNRTVGFELFFFSGVAKCVYLYFEYGEEEGDLTTPDDGARIQAEVNSAYWEIESQSDVKIGRYWKLMPVQDFPLPPEDDPSLDEVAVHFLDVKCNGMPGITPMHIRDEQKNEKLLEITKYPEPKIEHPKVVSPGPYIIGKPYQIGWSLYEASEFRLYCDGEDVTEKVEQQGDVCNLTVPARWEPYQIAAENAIGDRGEAKIAFELEFIKSVSITEIQQDHVAFAWDLEAENISWCRLVGLEEQAIDIVTTSKGAVYEGQDITGTRRFEFQAGARDSLHVDKLVLEYHCPEILEFELLGSNSGLSGQAEEGRITSEEGEDGFISVDFLKKMRQDPKVFCGQSISCKGGGPTIYDHHYRWQTEYVESCRLQMDSGERYENLPANADDWTASTTSGKDQALLTAIGSGGYRVEQRTGKQTGRRLEWCSFEITKMCNLDCEICLCGGGRETEDELTTEEALKLCGQLRAMGVKRVVLTGGEPLMREDWDKIAMELTGGGIEVQLVTNGFFIDRKMAERIERSGINRVTVSIDGTEAVHDRIRARGSFARCRMAVEALRETSLQVFAATTVTEDNFEDLAGLRAELERMRIQNWVLHLGLPYGNFVERKVKVLGPDKMMDLIDFCYDTAQRGSMAVYPGDSIGCYTKKEILVRRQALGTDSLPVFQGCPAGISTLGIGSNGDILTISMCVDGFIAGNIRHRPLREIWEDDENPAWRWRRKLRREDLQGVCRECEYGELCLGGCPAVRYSMTGEITGENQLCAYRNLAVDRYKKR